MKHPGNQNRAGQPQAGSMDRSIFLHTGAVANASLVNRTHRVVRERARVMQAHRRRVRDILIPVTLCSGLLLIAFWTVWVILDQYEIAPTGIPDASNQFFMLLLWFLPVSAALIAFVWLRRARNPADAEANR